MNRWTQRGTSNGKNNERSRNHIDVTLEDDGLGALAFTDPETPPQMFRISYDALYEEIDELYGNGRGGLITDPDEATQS